MKQKYLALALSAVFATALAGCGSDDDSNYQPQLPDTENSDNGGDTGGDNGGDTGGDNGGDTGGDNGGDTGGDNGGDTGGVNTDGTTGIGGAQTGQVGETDSGPVVAAVQTIRSAGSEFDALRNPANSGKNAAATLLADLPLQNKKMTNIVVGAEVLKDDKDADIVTKRFVGEDADSGQEDPTNAASLQTENAKNVLVTSTSFADTALNNGLVKTTVTKVPNNVGLGSTYVTDFAGEEAEQTTASRFFGSYYLASENEELENSHSFAIRDAEGNKLNNLKGVVNPDNADAFTLDSTKIKLDNVQYGRVTANIEPLDQDIVKDLNVQGGNSYYVAPFANKGAENATDVYFYRGLNETAATHMPTQGKFEYAGHALMYGIDNSYHGTPVAGTSNSFSRGAEGEALGNFVQATVDFDTRSVGGSVYNVWLGDSKKDAAVVDNLVSFNGAIGEANSINGTATRDYVKNDTAATFHGSFYGDKATEMGGSFNSVTDGQKFGQVGWGGVFGAKQLKKDDVVIDNPTDNGNGGIGQ
ncbi:transferrin-binding protein-like solute binding protein [Psychrobacter celer]|uniref:transferrin-binding protein-like solute binding protein n=1 Tax=Psychrobacter celer TaxID=306572 RepID=UPI003FD30695